ncbi:MAG: 30S ribosomal protein S19e [Candidatus Pacearchaeota archaeon]
MEKTLYDIEPGKYVEALAKKLGEKEFLEFFEMPTWAYFVKTSAARARPPAESDWWLKRAASILRQVYIKGVIGVEKLRTRYGGRKDRGMRPKEFRKGSGKIIRTILQQAEKAGLLEKVKDKRSGRKLTKKGKQLLDAVAKEL